MGLLQRYISLKTCGETFFADAAASFYEDAAGVGEDIFAPATDGGGGGLSLVRRGGQLWEEELFVSFGKMNILQSAARTSDKTDTLPLPRIPHPPKPPRNYPNVGPKSKIILFPNAVRQKLLICARC